MSDQVALCTGEISCFWKVCVCKCSRTGLVCMSSSNILTQKKSGTASSAMTASVGFGPMPGLAWDDASAFRFARRNKMTLTQDVDHVARQVRHQACVSLPDWQQVLTRRHSKGRAQEMSNSRVCSKNSCQDFALHGKRLDGGHGSLCHSGGVQCR
ncbi:hypothetical protein CCHR01_02233 [Colletotrichum chrysophilum]|uniref:Uncharacterized protein n=1 Tax=Colletotrichum chrysophilum TaxID=1836956 RepID=A0AAD9ENS3_9PEZI|nr:hypothetical protein CCHR01_02233 [Colletotrichum chrysophilum]